LKYKQSISCCLIRQKVPLSIASNSETINVPMFRVGKTSGYINWKSGRFQPVCLFKNDESEFFAGIITS